jgi:proteic killer suppression protein
MIRTFNDKQTQKLFEGENPRKFSAFRYQAERKLHMLDMAVTLDFLRSPLGNRLEALSGDRQGQYSIRINQQWRLFCCWVEPRNKQLNHESLRKFLAHLAKINMLSSPIRRPREVNFH